MQNAPGDGPRAGRHRPRRRARHRRRPVRRLLRPSRRWSRSRPTPPIVHEETFAPILYVMGYDNARPRRSRFTMPSRRAWRPPSSRPTSARPKPSSAPPAPTAASPTSTSAPAARKSAAPSAAKNKPAAAANPGPMPGRRTCAGPPTPSTIPTNCRWRRGFRSMRRRREDRPHGDRPKSQRTS